MNKHPEPTSWPFAPWARRVIQARCCESAARPGSVESYISWWLSSEWALQVSKRQLEKERIQSYYLCIILKLTQYQSSRRLFNTWVSYRAIIHEEHSWVNAGWSHLLYCEWCRYIIITARHKQRDGIEFRGKSSSCRAQRLNNGWAEWLGGMRSCPEDAGQVEKELVGLLLLKYSHQNKTSGSPCP